MEITRRSLLKGAGVAAAGAVLPLVPQTALAHGGGEGMGGEEPVGRPTTRLRRYAMVIDLRACDGCSGLGIPPQCTQFCNWSRYTPEDQQWIETYQVRANDFPAGHEHFMPVPCQQCQNAPCVNVCPVGASFHNPEGVVLIDQERCIGCRLCMAACPYDRRFFNWGEPVQPPQVKAAPYSIQTQVPAIEGTVMKCDFCTERAGAGGVPVCVEACPNGAIYFGDLEEGIATNGERMVSMSELLNEDGVERYKEDLGTEPRVYYIPGHGENAMKKVDQPRFRKDGLEWPWRQMNAELERLRAAAPALEDIDV